MHSEYKKINIKFKKIKIMEKKIFNKRNEIMNIANGTIVFHISAGENPNLSFSYEKQTLSESSLKELKKDLLTVLKASIDHIESLMFKNKDSIVSIENDRIIIKPSNEYYITIHLDYYRFVLCYYNLFIDAMDADFEKVYEKFMGGLKNEHGYYLPFTNDIVNTPVLGSYEERFILQNLVGRW